MQNFISLDKQNNKSVNDETWHMCLHSRVSLHTFHVAAVTSALARLQCGMKTQRLNNSEAIELLVRILLEGERGSHEGKVTVMFGSEPVQPDSLSLSLSQPLVYSKNNQRIMQAGFRAWHCSDKFLSPPPPLSLV